MKRRLGILVLLLAAAQCTAVAGEGEELSPAKVEKDFLRLHSEPEKFIEELAGKDKRYTAFLLKEISSGDRMRGGRAISLLYVAISPWQRGVWRSRGYYGQVRLYWPPARPAGRPVSHPQAKEIREALLKLMRPRYAAGGKKKAAWGPITPLVLAEVADDAAARELASFLEKETNVQMCSYLCQALETIYGLPPYFRPPIYDSLWRFMNQELARKQTLALCEKEKKKLAAWLKKHAGKPAKARMNAALDAWQSRLADPRGAWPGRFPTRELSSLIRLGKPLAPLLEKRKTKAGSIYLKGRLETVRAAITGKEDRKLVARLLKGGLKEQKTALEIIVAAGSRGWLKELEVLLDDAANRQLADRAAKTMAVCHGKEAIKPLKAAAKRNPKSMAVYCAKELELRYKRGPDR